jgi:hypothetical protein
MQSSLPKMHDMNTTVWAAFLATAVGLMSSCATPAPPAQMTLPFKPSDVAWSMGSGTASVEGTAAIPAGGEVHTCAGGEAQLFAAGAYAAEMMRLVFGSDVRGYAPVGLARYPSNVADDFKTTVRRARCDANGHFRLDGVPAGRWYVFSNVIFRGPGGDPSPQGGALMQRVDVAPGADVKVVLAP